MNNKFLLAQLAVNIMQAFLVMNGFVYSGGFDIEDSNCYREIGPHVVITICGCATDDADLCADSLWVKFLAYLEYINALPGTFAKFAPYDLRIFDYPEAHYVYISLSQ